MKKSLNSLGDCELWRARTSDGAERLVIVPIGIDLRMAGERLGVEFVAFELVSDLPRHIWSDLNFLLVGRE